MKTNILGVLIDKIDLISATSLIKSWIKSGGGYYVVTPNVEMIVSAHTDPFFKVAINNADLSIPDSARIGWADLVLKLKNPLKRLFYWPFFIIPTLMPGMNFPITTGTDLMEKLIQESSENGYRIGFLGGRNNVAVKLFDCLKAKYPSLNIGFIQENLEVDLSGEHKFFNFENIVGFKENQLISDAREQDFYKNLNSHKLDILFVAFGHQKQEKWMYKNLKLTNVRVMIGVGGAFDYLSGEVKRSPIWLRSLGFEWLYRLIQQPWRLFRFGNLLKFVFMVLLFNRKTPAR